jgi:hypothetical protein
MRERRLIQRPPVLVSLLLRLNLHGWMMTDRVFLLLAALVLPLVIVGCDAAGGGGDTATLNAGSTVPPTVEYLVRYRSENVSNDGQTVEDSSDTADDLSGVLQRNGFSRSNVVSARVDSVAIESRSPSSSPQQTKVFAYLRGVTVFLGTDPNTRTEIASGRFATTEDRVTLSGPELSTQNVTQDVKEGPKKAFLRLDASGGSVPSEDALDLFVYYTITVEGV